jgi:hypothetical protein
LFREKYDDEQTPNICYCGAAECCTEVVRNTEPMAESGFVFYVGSAVSNVDEDFPDVDEDVFDEDAACFYKEEGVFEMDEFDFDMKDAAGSSAASVYSTNDSATGVSDEVSKKLHNS